MSTEPVADENGALRIPNDIYSAAEDANEWFFEVNTRLQEAATEAAWRYVSEPTSSTVTRSLRTLLVAVEAVYAAQDAQVGEQAHRETWASLAERGYTSERDA